MSGGRTLRVLSVVALVLGMIASAAPANTQPVRAGGNAAAVSQLVPPAPPDTYVPAEGLLFNHPFRSDRGQISRHIIRMINSTAAGSTIKIAAFGIASRTAVDALIAARNRGVSVQVIGDAHLVNPKHDLYSPGFVRLRRALGRDHTKPSWAMVCNHSCRGVGGNMHAKYYLFDNVSGVQWVSVTGSANLTTYAVRGQWNHAKTVIDQTVYDQLVGVFNQMTLDQPASPVTLHMVSAPFGDEWIFPMPTISEATDPVSPVLAGVQCLTTQPDNTVVRTKIRIAMYAWFNARGVWLAKRVRSLWNQGCDVAIEIGIGSKSTRTILRSRSGRGPIPAKRVVTHDATGALKTYLHSKYVTILGNVNGNPNAAVVISGTCNFTALGNYSDEFTSIYDSPADVAAYNADFAAVWGERVARNWRTVSPAINWRTVSEDDGPTLGQGRLWRAEPD